MIKEYKLFINGEWIDAQEKEKIVIYSPTTSDVYAKLALGKRSDAKIAIEAAYAAFNKWQTIDLTKRIRYTTKIIDLFAKKTNDFAIIEAKNIGKPLKYSIEKEYPFLIENSRKNIKNFKIIPRSQTIKEKEFIKREPVGVVALFIPSNNPLHVLIKNLIPIILEGNTVVIKPSNHAFVSILEFVELTRKANFPKGIINLVTGSAEDVGNELCINEKVDMISFTGSIDTARKILSETGINFKKLHFEIKGKTPLILLSDVDVKKAAKEAVRKGFQNTGQDLTSVTRVYVPKKLETQLEQEMIKEARKMILGDPTQKEVDIGPLVSAKQRDKIEGYIQSAKEQGDTIIYGGKRPNGRVLEKGFFIMPTIVKSLKPKTRFCREDISGPLISVITYKEVEDIIEDPDCTTFGVAASIWGKKKKDLQKLVNRLKYRNIWINEHKDFIVENKIIHYKNDKILVDRYLETYVQLKNIYCSGEANL